MGLSPLNRCDLINLRLECRPCVEYLQDTSIKTLPRQANETNTIGQKIK